METEPVIWRQSRNLSAVPGKHGQGTMPMTTKAISTWSARTEARVIDEWVSVGASQDIVGRHAIDKRAQTIARGRAGVSRWTRCASGNRPHCPLRAWLLSTQGRYIRPRIHGHISRWVGGYGVSSLKYAAGCSRRAIAYFCAPCLPTRGG